MGFKTDRILALTLLASWCYGNIVVFFFGEGHSHFWTSSATQSGTISTQLFRYIL
jgi:hypothetical protein